MSDQTVKIWILILILVAVLDEWTKKYVPGRHMSIAEMGINIIGAAIGVGIIWILYSSNWQ